MARHLAHTPSLHTLHIHVRPLFELVVLLRLLTLAFEQFGVVLHQFGARLTLLHTTPRMSITRQRDPRASTTQHTVPAGQLPRVPFPGG